MSSNYEWQRHQVDERLRTLRREAADHRIGRGKQKKETTTGRRNLIILVLITIGLFVVGFQISGCTPAEVAAQGADAAAMNEAPSSGEEALDVAARAQPGLTMAERIAFQDRIAQGHSGDSTIQTPSPSITMADRLRFHDRLSK